MLKQRRLVLCYRRVGQPVGPIFKGKPLNIVSIFQGQPLNLGEIGCSETSVTNYQSMLRKITEELRFQGTDIFAYQSMHIG
jgi:hypothetical protein